MKYLSVGSGCFPVRRPMRDIANSNFNARMFFVVSPTQVLAPYLAVIVVRISREASSDNLLKLSRSALRFAPK
jgi:hypothetical protein